MKLIRLVGYLATSASLIAFHGGPACALPVISEIMYDGIGSDAPFVFTEIYGTAGLDLTGWALVGVNGFNGLEYRTLDLTGAVIPPDGILVVATSSALGDVLAARDFTGSVDWQNGPDAVWLRDATGTIVDAIQYGDAGSFNAGEGTPAPDAAAGWSLARADLLTDFGDNFADFELLDVPTPGHIPGSNPEPVPEPATMFLTGLGLVAVGGFRRVRR